jgi:hypothetical protein
MRENGESHILRPDPRIIFTAVLISGLFVACLILFISITQSKNYLDNLDKEKQQEFNSRIVSDKRDINEELRVRYSDELGSFEKTHTELQALRNKLKQAEQKTGSEKTVNNLN